MPGMMTMELKLSGGDYAVTDGRLDTVSGAAEILQRVLMKLAARRGSFAPMPDFGSRLHLLPEVKTSERAALCEAYVAEALAGEPEVAISSVGVSEAGGALRVALTLRYKGDDLDLALSI